MKKMKHKLEFRTEGDELLLVCTDEAHGWSALIAGPEEVYRKTRDHSRDVEKHMPAGVYEVAGYGGPTYLGWLRPDRSWKSLDKPITDGSANTPSSDYLTLIGLYDGPEK
jgi:hypothetical protein